MTARERVLAAVAHRAPDRTPTDFQATDEVWALMCRHLDTDREGVLQRLDIDCRWVGPPYRAQGESRADGTYVGYGGSFYRTVRNAYGAYEEVVRYVLDEAETPADVDRLLTLPRLEDYDYGAIPGQLAPHAHRFLLTGGCNAFYNCTRVRSMENVLIDMYENPELLDHLVARFVDYELSHHERILRAGQGRIDAMQINDDLATQRGPIFSTEMFRRFFKEPLRQMASLAKAYGAKVFFHCCGSAHDLLEELIEIGIDILDPVQTSAANMEPARLKAAFGDRLCFHGAVDGQHTLPSGTPEDVRAAVRHLVRVLGEGGGYILSSCHALQPDVSAENILALYDPALR